MFSKRGAKVRFRSQLEVADLNVDRDVMHLNVYAFCQTRAMHLDDIFMHGKHSQPQSLSDHVNSRANNKSDPVRGLLGRFHHTCV